jgi:hypothetical protein
MRPSLLEWLEDQAVIGTCWELAPCDRALYRVIAVRRAWVGFDGRAL